MLNKRTIATLGLVAGLLVPTAAAQASSPPPIAPPAPLKVKWILPPRSSAAYASEKALAESMGYETVENDDLSYPGH